MHVSGGWATLCLIQKCRPWKWCDLCFRHFCSPLQEVATQCMTAACTLVGNRDIENMVPLVISSIANPAEVQDTVHKLAATTFVQQVESPALSIMVPLLLRGLRERVTAIKRKAALIADNMSKLVDNPAEAMVFLPRLMPEIEKVGSSSDRGAGGTPSAHMATWPICPRLLPIPSTTRARVPFSFMLAG